MNNCINLVKKYKNQLQTQLSSFQQRTKLTTNFWFSLKLISATIYLTTTLSLSKKKRDKLKKKKKLKKNFRKRMKVSIRIKE